MISPSSKRSLVVVAIAAAALTAVALPAFAESAFAIIVGAKQGPIQGDETSKPNQGAITVIGVSHSILSPRDPQTGLPAVKRLHKPFVIKKLSDKASTKLLVAMATNELLSIDIRFYRPVATGATVLYHTFKFTGASIASFDTAGDTREGGGVVESISFNYQKIDVIDHINNQAASDTGSEP
jgi:type VI secretion system secreted protein Hcp